MASTGTPIAVEGLPTGVRGLTLKGAVDDRPVDVPVLADVTVQAAHAAHLLPIYTSEKALSFKTESGRKPLVEGHFV